MKRENQNKMQDHLHVAAVHLQFSTNDHHDKEQMSLNLCLFFLHQNLTIFSSFYTENELLSMKHCNKWSLFLFWDRYSQFSVCDTILNGGIWALIYSTLYKFQAHVNYFSAFQAHLKCGWVIKRCFVHNNWSSQNVLLSSFFVVVV